MTAFIMVAVTQRKLANIAEALEQVPEVLEVHGLSGVTDLLVHIVARDADDLYRVAGRILDIDGVEKTTTGLVMRRLVDYRLTRCSQPAPKFHRTEKRRDHSDVQSAHTCSGRSLCQTSYIETIFTRWLI